jgi:tRNA-specific 2-thiouridylase
MPKDRVVVAMSGGVDSSVAAALLVEQGHEVIGLMLRLWQEPGEAAPNSCCTDEAVQGARELAARLDFPFYLLHCEQRFREQVVEHFIAEYSCGHTPNPCLTCNRHIKFGYLLQMALALDARYLATGHYARIRREGERYQLLRATDRTKDQSYVLHMLGQSELEHVILPIGEMTKKQVRELAAQRGLPMASKKDSQEICFIHDQDYRRFLRAYAPEAIQPGPILNAAGRELGRHQGLPFYTIGQRSGLGITWPEPLYVLDIDQARNALIVGPASELGRKIVCVKEVSFVAGNPPPFPARVTTKIRYTGAEVAATLESEGEGLRLVLDAPLRDITPGQAAVFYQAEVVLGGGIIIGSANLENSM